MLTVMRDVLIEAPRESVSAYVRDIGHLADYEPKVETCQVSYPDDQTALAAVTGIYLGLPWQGVFEMKYTPDGGFLSRMVRGPMKTMRGGFHLTPQGRVTRLTHFEQYGFPLLLRPLYPFLRRWLARSMDEELSTIKGAVEGNGLPA